MQKQDTASGGSPQDRPNLRTSADNISGLSERQTSQSLAAVEFDLSSDSGCRICEDHESSQHPAIHVAKEIANSPHNSSVACLRTFAHCKYRGGNVL
jgi:hypothetical protein